MNSHATRPAPRTTSRCLSTALALSAVSLVASCSGGGGDDGAGPGAGGPDFIETCHNGTWSLDVEVEQWNGPIIELRLESSTFELTAINLNEIPFLGPIPFQPYGITTSDVVVHADSPSFSMLAFHHPGEVVAWEFEGSYYLPDLDVTVVLTTVFNPQDIPLLVSTCDSFVTFPQVEVFSGEWLDGEEQPDPLTSIASGSLQLTGTKEVPAPEAMPFPPVAARAALQLDGERGPITLEGVFDPSRGFGTLVSVDPSAFGLEARSDLAIEFAAHGDERTFIARGLSHAPNRLGLLSGAVTGEGEYLRGDITIAGPDGVEFGGVLHIVLVPSALGFE